MLSSRKTSSSFLVKRERDPQNCCFWFLRKKTSRAEATRQTMWPFIHRTAPRAPSIGSVRFSFTPPPPALWSFGMGGGQTGGSFTRPGRLKRARESGRHTLPARAGVGTLRRGPGRRAARKKSNLAEKKAENLRACRAQPSSGTGSESSFFFPATGGREEGRGGAGVRRRWAGMNFLSRQGRRMITFPARAGGLAAHFAVLTAVAGEPPC